MTSTVHAFPLPAENFLPHRDVMCCIDTLLACDEHGIQAGVTLHPGHALLNADGVLEASGFIELAAQAGCALMGLAAADGEMPAAAWLAGVQDFVAHHDAVINDELVIHAAITRELGEIRVLEFHITRRDQWLANGSLKVFYQG